MKEARANPYCVMSSASCSLAGDSFRMAAEQERKKGNMQEAQSLDVKAGRAFRLASELSCYLGPHEYGFKSATAFSRAGRMRKAVAEFVRAQVLLSTFNEMHPNVAASK